MQEGIIITDAKYFETYTDPTVFMLTKCPVLNL